MTSTLHGIGEIVAYLPYQLGFVPRDSLAVVGMRERHIVVTARFDRPPRSAASELARHVVAAIGQVTPDEVLVLCYDGYDAADRLFVREARALLGAAQAEVSHVALVPGDGSWRAVECGCGRCPRDPTAVPAVDAVAPVAECVMAGVVPVATRAELAQRFDVGHPEVAAAVEDRLSVVRSTEVPTSRALPQVLLDRRHPVHTLPVEVLVAATRAVAEVRIRDQVLAWLMPDFLPVEVLDVHEVADPHHLGLPPVWLRDSAAFDDPVAALARRMQAWVGCIPPGWSVPVLMLSAALSWSTGDGVLAALAVERARQLDPACRLAVLLEAALQAGLRPVHPTRRGDPQRRRPA